jgi:hypothetical protein
MAGRTDKWIDERAQRDVDNGKFDPPESWFPGKSEDVDRYRAAWDHHNDLKNNDD